MRDAIPFFVLLIMIILQRMIELFVAHKNEKWMKEQGAIEFGAKHYQYMVLIHTFFFISLCSEKVVLNRGLSPIWPLLLIIFIISQGIRIWIISSLGKFWNTKIIVLPNSEVVMKGPYRYLKHPNYIVVSVELMVVPFLFESYVTAFLFTFLNIFILSIRIPEEEKALKNFTQYEDSFQGRSRFLPKFVKKV